MHPELSYVKIHDVERDANYILCDNLLSTLYKDVAKARKEKKFEVLEKYKGTDLVGKTYEPLFPYFKERVRHIPLAPSAVTLFSLIRVPLPHSTPAAPSASSATSM